MKASAGAGIARRTAPRRLRRVVGTLGVELVDMRTGRVLWVARASGEVAAGPGVEIELIQLLLGTALTEKRG